MTERAARRLRMLQELAEIGMDLARGVRRQALEQPAPEPDAVEPDAADLGLTFSRIAKAVRQTIALEARLEQDCQDRDQQAEADRTARRARARKAEIRRIVEQAIEADAHEDDVEHFLGELDERLQDDEDDADFADRPIGELVARICRHLGVTPDWSLWEDEDWANEEAGAPGSPYVVADDDAPPQGSDPPSPDDGPWPDPASGPAIAGPPPLPHAGREWPPP